MSQITKIELWKDVGFQEGAVEVPSKDDFLPDADIVFDDGVKTSSGDFFSNFTIPAVFSEYLSMSYVRVTYEYNNADDPMTFYGWIDDVALKSDTDGSPSVSISWHIDYWRTYLATAKFGYGLVQTRPRGENDPPQPLSYRYRELAKTQDPLIPSTIRGCNCYWGIISYAVETNDNKIVESHTLVVPVAKTGAIYYQAGPSTAKRVSLTINEWLSGKFDEYLGIAPSSISSVFISPLPPHKIYSGTGTDADPFVLSGTEGTTPETSTVTETAYDTQRTVSSVRSDSALTSKDIIITLEDGSTQKSFSGVYTVSSINPMYAYIYEGDSLIRTSQGPEDYLTVIPLDYIVKNTFGTEQWDSLSNGDTITVANAVDIYNSLDISYNAYAPTGQLMVLVNYRLGDKIRDRTFTFNNGTFGQHYIYANGRSNVLSLTITTTETVISSNAYTEVGKSKYGFYRNDGMMDDYSLSLPSPVATTDLEELVILDYNAIPVGTLPWGMTVQNYSVRNVVSSTSAYVQIRFDSLSSASEGLEFTIPLPSIDVASNSYSEYYFSGQRDYDIAQRKIAAEQALVGGITTAITGTVSNTIMAGINPESSRTTQVRDQVSGGQLINMLNKNDPSLVQVGGRYYREYTDYSIRPAMTKMVGSGVASLGAGIGGAVAEYALAQYFNGQLQNAEDMLQAKQIDSIMVNGSGWDFLYHGSAICLTSLKPDKYSCKRFEADKTLNGIICSEPMEDCTELINANGPLRIAELIVTGSIPVQARAHIKGRFANGVRIRTINTQTVTEGE